MPTRSKQPAKKNVSKKQAKQGWYKTAIAGAGQWIQGRMDENPHRSFRVTRRRDYVRPITLPNPLLFIIEVNQMLLKQWRLFLPLFVIYIALYAVLVGIGSQGIYDELSASLTEAGGSLFDGAWGAISQSGLTLLALVTTGINEDLNAAQRIFAVLLGLMAWLTIVWLLRNVLAGNKVKLRDGLYNSGSPILATLVVGLVIVLQLLPVALAAVGYSAAVSSGLLENGGVESMMFWVAAVLLGVLSLYWISSSLFAMVIVTLPGMYPFKALRTSRRILIGRRVKFLFRFIWMVLFVLAVWVFVLVPVILLDGWIKSVWEQIAAVPIVPTALLLVGTFTVFWVSTYIYLLYRKVVDNDQSE